MIGHFPDPYPDEIFYSLVARFVEHAGVRSKTSALRRLLGPKFKGSLLSFPFDLHYLVSRLPPSTKEYDVKYFLWEHTLLPLWAPVLSASHVRQLANYSFKTTPRYWLRTPRLAHSHLHYCNECYIVDKGKYGEPYWHRIHQVRGIVICPQHETLLVRSEVDARMSASYPLTSLNKLSNMKSRKDAKTIPVDAVDKFTLNVLYLLDNILIERGKILRVNTIRAINYLSQIKNYSYSDGKRHLAIFVKEYKDYLAENKFPKTEIAFWNKRKLMYSYSINAYLFLLYFFKLSIAELDCDDEDFPLRLFPNRIDIEFIESLFKRPKDYIDTEYTEL